MPKLYSYLLVSFFSLSIFQPLGARAQASGNALSYDGTDDFLSFPTGIVSSINADFTIEQYVLWRGGADFQKVFDFGKGTNEFMFLSPKGLTGVRFAITITGEGAGAQIIESATPLPLNVYTHVAVTIDNATNTGKLYINGVLSATNTMMTLRPASLLMTDQNWLGRSQFVTDPYFNGNIEELRISNVVRYTANFTPPPGEFTTDANTVALYHFNEGMGQTTNDATAASSFDGTLGGTLAAEASDPSWIMNSILPIKILQFNAIAKGNAVELSWKASATETESTFILERSADGSAFQPVKTIAGKTGTHQYQYTDAGAKKGRNYYRLQYTEPGARALYSRTVAVNSKGEKEIFVFPNPVKNGIINLELSTPHTGELRITLTNASGVTVYNQKLETNNSSQLRIDKTAGIPSGIYLLQIRGNGIQQAQHIICQ